MKARRCSRRSRRPGEVQTEVHDLDLKTRGGRTVPVRLYHKVAFAADGAPGDSRTLVLNRAREEVADPARAAEVRFMRFFHKTPMAIATVDKAGKIARTNAPFVRCSTASPRATRSRPRAARSYRRRRAGSLRAGGRDRARRRTGRATSRRSTAR